LPSENGGPPVAVIAAVAENNVIGRAGDLPWRLPSDLARFKRLTLGNTVVMGRRTHESIGRALPGRRTIVVSSRPIDGIETARSLPEAVRRAETPVFLAGGARIYAEGMALADTIFLTRVHARPSGDTFFPAIPPDFRRVSAEPGARGERDDEPFTYETFVRSARVD